MRSFPFQNSPAFAESVRTLRTLHTNWSEHRGYATTAVEKAGGPSTSHQGRIENSAAMPITAEVIANYDTALTELSGGVLGPGLFTALAGLHAASQWQEDRDQRSGMILRHAAEQSPRSILVGLDVFTNHPVHVSSIEMHPDLTADDTDSRHAPGDYLVNLSRSDAATFRNLAVRLARRHPSVTVADDNWGSLALLDAHVPPLDALWLEQGGSVHADAELVVDPIDGITTLREARDRAQILGASDHDAQWVGWIILFANALGQKHRIGALAAYIRYQNTEEWDNLRASLPTEVTGSFPATDHMKSLTQRCLSPWTASRTNPQFEMRFTIEGDDIVWHPDESPPPRTPIQPKAGDLWLYQPADLPLAQVLLARNAPGVLRLSSEALFALDPYDLGRGTQERWYSSGISDQFALIHSADRGWLPIQTY